ncbi:hypothetical protein QAD02_017302 [Eretmocerus hayati]|uniref:Uncharacterized protein n=1 Tax=Eretmocerus hayati TaxID=131215 RepID=A0ACC2PIB3_9HYME|nr:hypothetical protein QAD02_017302 [Eretmocerus hayati]
MLQHFWSWCFGHHHHQGVPINKKGKRQRETLRRRRDYLLPWLTEQLGFEVKDLTYAFLGDHSDRELIGVLENRYSKNLLDSPTGGVEFNEYGKLILCQNANVESVEPIGIIEETEFVPFIEDRVEYLEHFLRDRYPRSVEPRDLISVNDYEYLKQISWSILHNPIDPLRFSSTGFLIQFGPAPKLKNRFNRPIEFRQQSSQKRVVASVAPIIQSAARPTRPVSRVTGRPVDFSPLPLIDLTEEPDVNPAFDPDSELEVQVIPVAPRTQISRRNRPRVFHPPELFPSPIDPLPQNLGFLPSPIPPSRPASPVQPITGPEPSAEIVDPILDSIPALNLSISSDSSSDHPGGDSVTENPIPRVTTPIPEISEQIIVDPAPRTPEVHQNQEILNLFPVPPPLSPLSPIASRPITPSAASTPTTEKSLLPDPLPTARESGAVRRLDRDFENLRVSTKPLPKKAVSFNFIPFLDIPSNIPEEQPSFKKAKQRVAHPNAASSPRQAKVINPLPEVRHKKKSIRKVINPSQSRKRKSTTLNHSPAKKPKLSSKKVDSQPKKPISIPPAVKPASKSLPSEVDIVSRKRTVPLKPSNFASRKEDTPRAIIGSPRKIPRIPLKSNDKCSKCRDQGKNFHCSRCFREKKGLKPSTCVSSCKETGGCWNCAKKPKE